jgi:hypothetical protein
VRICSCECPTQAERRKTSNEVTRRHTAREPSAGQDCPVPCACERAWQDVVREQLGERSDRRRARETVQEGRLRGERHRRRHEDLCDESAVAECKRSGGVGGGGRDGDCVRACVRPGSTCRIVCGAIAEWLEQFAGAKHASPSLKPARTHAPVQPHCGTPTDPHMHRLPVAA